MIKFLLLLKSDKRTFKEYQVGEEYCQYNYKVYDTQEEQIDIVEASKLSLENIEKKGYQLKLRQGGKQFVNLKEGEVGIALLKTQIAKIEIIDEFFYENKGKEYGCIKYKVLKINESIELLTELKIALKGMRGTLVCSENTILKLNTILKEILI